jgi:hypothetical protein
MKKTKLKDLINESVLGELPSSKMFKYNKATGKFDAPGTTNEEKLDERLPTEKKVGDEITLSNGEKATVQKRLSSHKYAVKTASGQNKIINIDSVQEAKSDWMARGLNADIWIKGLPKDDSRDEIGEKIYYALIDIMKKHKFSPKEIIVKM